MRSDRRWQLPAAAAADRADAVAARGYQVPTIRKYTENPMPSMTDSFVLEALDDVGRERLPQRTRTSFVR